METILFVDDDRFFGKAYVDQLKEYVRGAYSIDVCTKIDDAVHYCHTHTAIRAIVLDVMMPPPQDPNLADDIAKETEDGFATGIWFLRYLRNLLVERQIRVFVLSNRNYDLVQTMVGALDYPSGLIECERKLAVPAASLPARVFALMQRAVG